MVRRSRHVRPPTTASFQALCTADISDMVAALTNGPAAGVATTSDCAAVPEPEDEPLGAADRSAGRPGAVGCWGRRDPWGGGPAREGLPHDIRVPAFGSGVRRKKLPRGSWPRARGSVNAMRRFGSVRSELAAAGSAHRLGGGFSGVSGCSVVWSLGRVASAQFEERGTGFGQSGLMQESSKLGCTNIGMETGSS